MSPPPAPATQAPPSGPRVGEVLVGKYRLEELLGSGGMGDVYRALNELVGRKVAIKILRKEHAQNDQVVERFLREAKAANLVRHPNVVDVLDMGKDDFGLPFIVQELLDGEDLAAFARRSGGRLSLEQTIDLVCPVIEAVAVAHATGVVHRDIKPENVFLQRKDRGGHVPKLLDFGISKVRSSDIRTTEAGVMLGTPAYMAPEQLQGARDADARTDVWAIGVMLFELLSGRLPFDAKDAPALFVKIATTDAPKLLDIEPDVAPTVSRLVDRCLRRKPDERYPSAAELARDLRHVMEGTEIEPTLRRSIPPNLAAMVPDLLLPKTPSAPKLAKEELIEAGLDSSDARQLAGNAAPPEIKKAAEAVVTAKAKRVEKEIPSLAPPPKAAPAPAPKPAPPKPAPAKPAPDGEAEIPLASSIAEDPRGPTRPGAVAPLPGLMMTPEGKARTRAAPSSTQRRPLPGTPVTAGDDVMPMLTGLGVVGMTAMIAFGVLMRVAHQSGGWQLLSFVAPPGSGLVTVGQAGLGLIAGAISVTYVRRGVKHWRGELAGGAVQAVFSGLLAAGAFFAAIELFSAAW